MTVLYWDQVSSLLPSFKLDGTLAAPWISLPPSLSLFLHSRWWFNFPSKDQFGGMILGSHIHIHRSFVCSLIQLFCLAKRNINVLLGCVYLSRWRLCVARVYMHGAVVEHAGSRSGDAKSCPIVTRLRCYKATKRCANSCTWKAMHGKGFRRRERTEKQVSVLILIF